MPPAKGSTKRLKRQLMLLAPKVPWIGVKGAFRDSRWANPVKMSWPYLEFEPERIVDAASQRNEPKNDR